jgi:hypothetical protein
MAKQSIPNFVLSYRAAAAVTRYRAVGFDNVQASVAGQKIKGVTERDAVSGDTSDLTVSGTVVVETGGAFGEGASLIVDNQGRAVVSAGKMAVAAGGTPMTSAAANGVAVLTGGDTPEFVFADALEASTGAGQFVEVLLRR